MMSGTMKHLLSTTYDGEQRKGSFDDHPFRLNAFETQFQAVGDTGLAAKAKISQDKAIRSQQIDQQQKILVFMIHVQSMPALDLFQAAENPTQFQPIRPMAFVSILGADLPCRTSLLNGKQQLNRKTIDDIEQTWFCQQQVRARFMPLQLLLKGCSLWQASKQRVIVPFQPALEGTKASPFQGEQYSDSNHLAWIQLRIAFFRQHSQSVIDPTKNNDDNQFRRHEALSIWFQHPFCGFFS